MAIGNFVDFVGARFNAPAISSYITGAGSAVDFVGSDDSTNGFTKLAYLIYLMRKEEISGYDVTQHKTILVTIASTENPTTEKAASYDSSVHGLNVLQLVTYIYRDDEDFSLSNFSFLPSFDTIVQSSIAERSGGYASAVDMAIRYGHNNTLTSVDVALFTYKGDVHRDESGGAPSLLIGLVVEGAKSFIVDGANGRGFVTANSMMDRVQGLASGLTYDEMFGPNPLTQSEIRNSKNYIYSILKTESSKVVSTIFDKWFVPLLSNLSVADEFTAGAVDVLKDNIEPFNNFKNAATSLSIETVQATISKGRLAGYTPAFPFVALVNAETTIEDLEAMDALFNFSIPVLKNGNDEGFTPLAVLTEKINIDSDGVWNDEALLGFLKSKIGEFEKGTLSGLRSCWGAIGGVNVSTNANVSNAYGIINSLFNKVYAAKENEEIPDGGTSAFPLAEALSKFSATEADYGLWVQAYK